MIKIIFLEQNHFTLIFLGIQFAHKITFGVGIQSIVSRETTHSSFGLILIKEEN